MAFFSFRCVIGVDSRGQGPARTNLGRREMRPEPLVQTFLGPAFNLKNSQQPPCNPHILAKTREDRHTAAKNQRKTLINDDLAFWNVYFGIFSHYSSEIRKQPTPWLVCRQSHSAGPFCPGLSWASNYDRFCICPLRPERQPGPTVCSSGFKLEQPSPLGCDTAPSISEPVLPAILVLRRLAQSGLRHGYRGQSELLAQVRTI